MKLRTRFPVFALPILCLLSACGFHAVYGGSGDSSPVATEMQQVAIDSIADRQGQILRNALIDRFYGKGRPVQPQYKLSAPLSVSQSDVGVLSNSVATLSEIDMNCDYVLRDTKGKELLRGHAHSQSSFSRLNDQYATLAAHDSAVERTTREISEQITNRISLYFAERKPTETTSAP
jgi:LPS-assembly lipoprotein